MYCLSKIDHLSNVSYVHPSNRAVKKVSYIIACLTIGFCSFGQDQTEKQTDSIVEEGKRLYKSEMASWYGTDVFLEQFKAREKIGGYFSYSDNDVNKCIFFSKEET